jgi:hypothetical protein
MEPLKPLNIVDDRPREVPADVARKVEEHLRECGPIVLALSPDNEEIAAASEWGQESPEGYSPIVGGAAYGLGGTLAEVLAKLVEYRR